MSTEILCRYGFLLDHQKIGRAKIMSTIPTKLSDSQFQQYILPHLSQAQRGFVCSTPLVKVFNYILY